MKTKTIKLLKSLHRTLFLMALLSVAGLAMAQESEVTINSASANNNWVPCYLTYNNTRAEMIYNASQLAALGEGKTITSIAFDGVSTEAIENVDFKLYVKETSTAQLTTEKADLSQFVKIFDGKADIKRNTDAGKYEEILHLNLDTPYPYTEGTALHFVLFTHSAVKTANVRFGHRSMTNVSGITYWNDGEEANERTTLYRTSYSPVVRFGLLSAGTEHECVTVGSIANTTCYGAPVSLSYTNSASETIYTAEDLNLNPNSTIHGINYTGWAYNNDNGEKFHFKVWMQNTKETEYTSSSKATPKESLTLVYDKEITIPKIGTQDTYTKQLNLKFDEDFVYTGHNLKVSIECSQVSGERGRRVYFGYDDSDKFAGRTLVAESADNLDSSRNLWVNGIPVTTFSYTAGDPVEDREPDVVLHTSKKKGSSFGIVIHTLKSGVYIDYGDGEKWIYPYGGSLLINNDVMGSEVKIWKNDEADLLQAVQSDDNLITKVDINTSDLEALYLRNNELTDGSIDFTNCKKLRIIDLTGNHYYNFTYSSDVVTKLILARNDLQQLDIPSMPNLNYLDVSINMLRSQAWIAWPSDAKNLTHLNLSYNMLYETPLSLWPNLEELIINNNNYTTLDFSTNTKLKKLHAFYTGISTFKLTKATELTDLNIMGTKFTKIDLSQNTKLESLDISKTSPSSLDLSSNTALKRLLMSDCLLSTFDFSPLTQLTYLDFSKNSISEPQLQTLTKLNYLNCSSNAIEAIDLSANTAIETLLCSVNKLQEIDLTLLTSLKHLDCSSNSLTSLNLKSNTSLERLKAFDNALTSLDVKSLKKLSGLDIKNNLFQAPQLQSLIIALPDVSALEVFKEDAAWKTIFAYAGNPGTTSVTDTYLDILDVKGWKAEDPHAFIGDASAAFSVAPELINTRLVFAIDCGLTKTFSVDWGDGKKVPYTVTGSTYQNLEHLVLGTTIRIYCDNAVELGVANLGITNLDVSGMPRLNRLSCSGNDIPTLDLTNNSELEHLVCGKGALSSMLLPENSKLIQLYCTNSLIRQLDLSGCPLLEDLDVSYNRLQALDLSYCPNLDRLHAYNNEIASLDLSPCLFLTEALLGFNKLQTIDVSRNVDLNTLSVVYNQLTSLDLTNNDYLKIIYCAHNAISDLKLNPTITTILAGHNQLQNIDLTTVPQLEEMELEHNILRTIDLTPVPHIKRIWLGYNQLESILMPTMNSCAIFNATDNRLTTFNAEAIPYASELILNNNQLSGTLNLSRNNSLQQLQVNNNHLTKITYPQRPSLVILYAAFNQLSTFKLDCSSLYAVDLSNNNLVVATFASNPALALLMLDYNQLSTLNVEKNSKLLGLTLRANLLDAQELNTLYEQLPAISVVPTDEYPWMSILAVSGNPGAAQSSRIKAHQKGWTVLYNEQVAETRNITINLSNVKGQPIADADILMLVNGSPISITPQQVTPGTYTFANFPVITTERYTLNITAAGYLPADVTCYDPSTSENPLPDGDIIIDVTLQSSTPDAIESIESQSQGLTFYNLNGVPVSKDNIVPGIYLVRNAAGKVTKRYIK